jgi:hypothetical protein
VRRRRGTGTGRGTTGPRRRTGGGRGGDPVDVLLIAGAAVAAALAVLPLLSVAGPVWAVWRQATRRLPAWPPLAALALLAGSAWLTTALVGQRPPRLPHRVPRVSHGRARPAAPAQDPAQALRPQAVARP